MEQLLINSAIGSTGTGNIALVAVWLICIPIPLFIGVLCSLFAKRVAPIVVGILASVLTLLLALHQNDFVGMVGVTLALSLLPVVLGAVLYFDRRTREQLLQNADDGLSRKLSDHEKKYLRRRPTSELEETLQSVGLLPEASEYIQAELTRRRREICPSAD